MMKFTTNMLVVVLCVATLAACGGTGPSSTSGSANGGGTSTDEDPIDEATDAHEGSGGTTISGNPFLINLSGAMALALEDKDNDNFKKVVGGDLQSVFVIPPTSGTSSVDVTMSKQVGGSDDNEESEEEEIDIPRVNTFWQGPNGEVVMSLAESVTIDDDECSYLYYRERDGKTACLPETFDGTPQFDAAGNVYFLGGSILKSWNPDTNQIRSLTNANNSVSQWLVHASGDVFFQGSSGGASVFRRIRATGGVQDYLDGGAAIYSFRFTDQNHILLDAYNLNVNGARRNGLFVLTISGDEVGLVEGPLEIPNFNIGAVNAFRQASNSIYYAFGSSNNLPAVAAVYPGIPHVLPLSTTGIRQFKVIDLNLYIVGQINSKHALLLFHLNDEDEPAVDLLGDENIEVYHFVVINNLLYFDGLLMSEGEIIFGEIDLNTRQLTQLSVMPNQFDALDVRQSIRNESFTAVDDVRDLVDPPFSVTEEDVPVFQGLGTVAGVKLLQGNGVTHLGALADTSLSLFDISGDMVVQTSQVDVLSTNDSLSNYNNDSFVRRNDLIYLTSSIGFAYPGILAIDVSDIQTPELTSRDINESYLYYSQPVFVEDISFWRGTVRFDIVNLSDPQDPVEITTVEDRRSDETYFSVSGSFFNNIDFVIGDELANRFVLLATGTLFNNERGLYSLNLDNAASGVVNISSFVPLSADASGSDYEDGTLYLQEGANLGIYTVPDDFSSIELVSRKTIWTSDLSKMMVVGDHAFFKRGSQLFVVDVHNQSNPRLVQIVDTGTTINTFYVTEGDDQDAYTVYVGTNEDLRIFHLEP